MFKPLVIGSRMELVSKKSLRNNEERIVYASQILDFNDDSIVCAMPIYEGRIVPLEAGKRFDAYFYVGTKIFRADCTAIDRGRDNNPRFQHSVVNTYLNLLLNSIDEITLRLF